MSEPVSDTSRHGLVALGDSITRASGEAMLGLAMRSWALWLAEALELPFTCLAVNGARASDARLLQLPRLKGPYDVGCVYIGVNDVRSPDWHPESYSEDLDAIVAAVASSARTLLLLRLPQQIGRPPAPREAIAAANRTIELVGARHCALVVDLASMQGAELVLPDAVHLTARGEAHLAQLAAARLGEAGIPSEQREIREALTPLGACARLRYAGGAGALARLRDWRRRLSE